SQSVVQSVTGLRGVMAPPDSIFDDLDRHLGAVRHGKPCLLLKSRMHVTVACGARVAKTVEHKQLRRDRLAAIVTLAFLGVDADSHRFLRPRGDVSSLADPSRCPSSFWWSWSTSRRMVCRGATMAAVARPQQRTAA